MTAHGITLLMRWIKPPAPRWVHRHPAPAPIWIGGEIVGYSKPVGVTSYVNPEKDRSLPGKARIRARRAGRR